MGDYFNVLESQNIKRKARLGLRAWLGWGLGDKDVTCMPKRRSTMVGWRNHSSQASLGGAHLQPYLGSNIGIRAFIFFLVEVGIGMVLSLEAKDGTDDKGMNKILEPWRQKIDLHDFA